MRWWTLEVACGGMVRSSPSGWNLKVNSGTGFADRLMAERERECMHRVKDDTRAFGLSNRKDEVTV